MRHRRRVLLAWVLAAVGFSVLAAAAGRHYATNFTLPGTESQTAVGLLQREFRTQSGDLDTIVFHTTDGTVRSAGVEAAVQRLLRTVRSVPHVTAIVSPFSQAGALQIAPDARTAFASVLFDRRANALPDSAGKPILAAVAAAQRPGLEVAAGGQVIENAEGFTIGPATLVGIVAALVILLLTFGSMVAAGMPLVTAGFGLLTGVALIGLATHVTSMASVAPEMALMVGLGVGIDYALFIVTRFRENFERLGDVDGAVLDAMDTSGRAILLAGTTVVIALLGMFATGVAFMYGMAVASVIAVLLTMLASLTVLPAMLSRFGERLVRPARLLTRRRNRGPKRSLWRRWSVLVQTRPKVLALVSLLVMVAFVVPVATLRLANSDAGNDPAATSSRRAFDLLAAGFGPGFNGPLQIVADLGHSSTGTALLPAIRSAVTSSPDVAAVAPARVSPSGTVGVIEVFPASAPQAAATTDLVHRLRSQVLPPLEHRSGVRILVGGFTAGSIDFASVLAGKLPLFIGIVVVLSALLLFVIFRSLVIPIQAAAMNLLSIGGALGATVLVFEKGFLGGLLGVEKGPVEPWIPVLMFAVVFGLSMDYEVFLISRVREEWVRRRDASLAVADGIALTGRVISAAAAIMVCVFLSFMLGDERSVKEFGFGLAVAVFLDALVVRCVLLPAVLELLGPWTWRLPGWIDRRLPVVKIEGTAAHARPELPPDPEADADELLVG